MSKVGMSMLPKSILNLALSNIARLRRLPSSATKKWQKWMIKIMDPFTRRTEEQFFDLEQLDDAWQWITESD